MPNQTFSSYFLLFVAILVMEFFLLPLFFQEHFHYSVKILNFRYKIDVLLEMFDLFSTKSENGEVLKTDYSKMDHLNLKSNQIKFLFEEVLVLNFLLLLFIPCTIFYRL
jgi:hypothetical protein